MIRNMKRALIPAIPAVFLLLALSASAQEVKPQALTAEMEKDAVVVKVAGVEFTRYKFNAEQKYPYFFPVIGPQSGKSVTTETSMPFPHHHSLFFGCDRVNKGNYWQESNLMGQIVSEGPKIAQASGESVVFTDECVWRHPLMQPVLKDRRRVTISAPGDKLRIIDFEITLLPQTDVVIEKTNHSLFSGRMAPELNVASGGTLINAEGKKNEKETFGVESPWCDFYGTRDGITEGMAIFQHPENKWYPAKWFTRDYGFFSPTPMYWPDGDSTRIPKGQELTLRYRVVVHAGDIEMAGIASLFAKYAGSAGVEKTNADFAQLEADLAIVKTYKVGESRKPLIRITELVRKTRGRPQRKGIEERLIAFLEAEAGFDGKQFVCHQLSEVGTELSVPILSKLLTDKELSDPARYALERIPSPKADESLHAALAQLDGKLKIGVIVTIGNRRDKTAIPELAKLAAAQDVESAATAVSALGRMGNKEAAAVLRDLKVSKELAEARVDAMLTCADRMLADGKTDAAVAVYRDLASSGATTRARIGGFEGLVRSGDAAALPNLIESLKSDDPLLLRAASDFAARIAGADATTALCDALPGLPPDAQCVLLGALAGRGDKTAVPSVVLAAQNTDAQTVRIAAIRALGSLGDATTVGPLAKIAAGGGDAGKAAIESLAVLSGEGVDAAMTEAMKQAEPGVRSVLISGLLARGYKPLVPALLDMMAGFGAQERSTAARALSALAGPEHAARLVELLIAAKDQTERREMELAVAGAISRSGKPGESAQPVIDALATADDSAKPSLITLLRRIGDARCLLAAQGQLDSQNQEVRRAAVQSISDWPNPEPLPLLLELAAKDSNEAVRVIALRGAIRQIALPSKRTSAESVTLLGQAMKLATRPEEKRAVLAALAGFPGGDAVALAESFVKDEQVGREAAAAIEKLKRRDALSFDFQPKGAPVMEGFTEVNAGTLFNEQVGYGWLAPPKGERDREQGTKLTRDLLFDNEPRTFRVRVPNGPCAVACHLGDMANGHDRMEVRAEGETRLTGITTAPGEVRAAAFEVNVEDGFLDLEFRDAGGSDGNWTCAGVVIGRGQGE
ncbi:MAG TPA: PmoA family protein [Candidatus Brocadiia bacterium]|nr:PmoA family protein [Candidatus Brocadiia bacterium]